MKEKILVLDNYDSFTYNLVHYIKELTDSEVVVKRNDEIDIEEIDKFDIIIFSPGPGIPQNAGIMIDAIRKYGPNKKILGVCLGHQAIGYAYGADLKNLDKVYHGIQTPINIINSKDKIFNGISIKPKVGRYHSWVIDKNTIGENLEITAESEDGQIMAIKHKQFDVWGLQFHPESIMTGEGKRMIKNFLEI